MQNSSIKSLPLSVASSLDAEIRGFLDDDDCDEIERFQVITCLSDSTQNWKILKQKNLIHFEL